MRKGFLALLFVLAVVLLLADGAAACAVCAVGEDPRSRDTYILSTVMMSSLPLLLVGGLVWYVRRRARALNASEPGQASSV